jgi:hypothetical protein
MLKTAEADPTLTLLDRDNLYVDEITAATFHAIRTFGDGG